MNKKQLVAGILAGSLLFCSAVSASAKKAVKARINQINETANYVTGKATPKATVKMSRKGIVYAVGKANNKGVFKLKVKHDLSPDWKYTVTAAKPGYQAAKTVVPVVPAKQPAVAPTPTVTAPQPDTPETPSADNSQQPTQTTPSTPTSVDANSDPQVIAITNQISDLKLAQQKLVNDNNDLKAQAASLMQKYETANANYQQYLDDKNNGTVDKLTNELAQADADFDALQSQVFADSNAGKTITAEQTAGLKEKGANASDLASRLTAIKAAIAAVGANPDEYLTTLTGYQTDSAAATAQTAKNDQQIAAMTDQINALYLKRIDRIGELVK